MIDVETFAREWIAAWNAHDLERVLAHYSPDIQLSSPVAAERVPGSGGYVEMSAVGFNSDKTLALLYAGHSCGGLCGGGTYHLLKKADGKWTEINWPGTTCTWVS